jgi:hypothetical protein
MKTRRILPWLLILLIAAGLASFLGYRSSARRARTPRIVVERDQSDIATLRGSSVLASYDPYFNRVNFTRDVMLSPTNSGSAESKLH